LITYKRHRPLRLTHVIPFQLIFNIRISITIPCQVIQMIQFIKNLLNIVRKSLPHFTPSQMVSYAYTTLLQFSILFLFPIHLLICTKLSCFLLTNYSNKFRNRLLSFHIKLILPPRHCILTSKI